ncbi:MAG: HlyC/CorC family transporter [Pseudobdellovibrionaceae bacterium]
MLLATSLAIFTLLLLSAFFSGSETAFTAASRARLRTLEKEGNARASDVLHVIEKKERMIGALLLGNNLVNILASALATSLFITLFGDKGVFYATAIMTVLVLIFAEVLPKTYALHHANTLTLFLAPFIRILIFVLSPITELITGIVRVTLKIFGADISKVKSGSHVELLRGVIELYVGDAEEVQAQRAMLRSILDLADVEVEEIMTHRKNVTMIDASMEIEQLVNEVLSSPYTRIPVYRNEQDNIIGVLHAKQLLRALHENNNDFSKIVLDEVISAPWFIPDVTPLYDQLQAFKKRREHFAVVVDEYGTFLGVVTLEDILEEIVGEIDDEHDITVPGVRKEANGSVLVQGSVTIRDLNRQFEWNLPDDEDYSTVAGLVLYESQILPEAGQAFVFHGFRFQILKKSGNQLALLRITPQDD